jgi:hypothetical protein
LQGRESSLTACTPRRVQSSPEDMHAPTQPALDLVPRAYITLPHLASQSPRTHTREHNTPQPPPASRRRCTTPTPP